MQQIESWPRYETISGDNNSTLDGVIAKPWGREYRIYRDPFFDIWLLKIEPGQSTSEHCHPRKSTALICVSGEGHLDVLSGRHVLRAHDIVVIGKGVFHSTRNIGDQPLEVIEVEVPRNKFDLVRAGDAYGRKASHYADPPIDEIAVATMKDTPLLSYAKYRPFCATGRHRFDVVRGDELSCSDPLRDGAFSVILSLATSCALNDRIVLLASPTEWPRTVDPAGVYFTILESPLEECAGEALTG